MVSEISQAKKANTTRCHSFVESVKVDLIEVQNIMVVTRETGMVKGEAGGEDVDQSRHNYSYIGRIKLRRLIVEQDDHS